ncbi:copper chaperone CopZ [Jatrophihabitans sp. GAS493]|uniref:heavy-metal-associated domain-containing protein n=1 Tax=Jatrophihabitans sp. GAS493 TaxID=1907575 RepID=UPI000BB8DC38|nr:heavy-metal-associated domain-containing protein [Jatrophihabitans sp. GAS493]SOD71437.1 copper chaperone CopZ [Jatrophihabitans sp. GAS493]
MAEKSIQKTIERTIRKTYSVSGMTCEHCAKAVRAEVKVVDGVTAVSVDLPTGLVHVSGVDFTDADIAAAVDEAGYSVAP